MSTKGVHKYQGDAITVYNIGCYIRKDVKTKEYACLIDGISFLLNVDKYDKAVKNVQQELLENIGIRTDKVCLHVFKVNGGCDLGNEALVGLPCKQYLLALSYMKQEYMTKLNANAHVINDYLGGHGAEELAIIKNRSEQCPLKTLKRKRDTLLEEVDFKIDRIISIQKVIDQGNFDTDLRKTILNYFVYKALRGDECPDSEKDSTSISIISDESYTFNLN